MKIKAAIIGYGNVGRAACEALGAAPDFKLVGIVSAHAGEKERAEQPGAEFVRDIAELSGKADVALICTATRDMPETAERCLALGLNAVDTFDMHAYILETRARLDKAAKAAGRVSVLSSGWDPGLDSIVRALLLASAPRGITYTNFGPGMSMGHSVAARSVEGVGDALSVTIPLGSSLHRRMVYITLEEGYALEEVAARIKADEYYFAHDETHVIQVEDVRALMDMGSGVSMTRKGVSGETDNQLFEFSMRINNPALTAQLMVASARAAARQAPGCYTMIELPVIDLLPGDRDALIRGLV